jgi:glycosyltransferase involved in cell wall biosynthesis
MRVLLMHNGSRSDLPSGESIVFHDEATMLAEAGVTVDTLHLRPSAQESGMERIIAGARTLWSRPAYRMVRERIGAFCPDVVHAHSVLPDLTVSALAACRDAGIPVVQTLHNYRWLCVEGGLFRDGKFCRECIEGTPRAGVRYRCARGSLMLSLLLSENNRRYVRSGKLFQWVDHFLPVSHFARQQFLEAGFPANRMTVKYNSVRAIAKDDVVAREHRNGRICFAGRLDRAKGTEVLRDLVRRYDQWSWTVLGSGPEWSDWKALQAEVGGARLELAGRVSREDVQREFAKASLVIAPSIVPESFGLVAAEAMACGTPVVATHLGGLIELIREGRAGLTVPVAEGRDGMASAIDHLLAADGTAWQAASTAGQAFVKRHLARDVILGDLMQLYQGLLTCRSGAVKSNPSRVCRP